MTDREKAYAQGARELYAENDDVEFDNFLRAKDVSESAEGAWVRAWVWVDVEDVGLEPLEDEA